MQQVTDPRVRTYIMPRKILWQTGIENPNTLLQPGTGQVVLDQTGGCVLRNEGSGAGLLLDFGQELQGGVQIISSLTSDYRPVRLRVRFGESAGEAMCDIGYKHATNDHAIRDQYCLAPWSGSLEIGTTGFRFVRIDAPDPGTFVELMSVRAVALNRDLKYEGAFRCNDDRLNRIWSTGAHTLHLCMQDYLWDGIKRDRLVWIGDMHPEVRTLTAVFGEQSIVPHSLDFVRDAYPLPQWMNHISAYSMWWLIIQEEWYRYTGRREYVILQRDYLVGLLNLLVEQVDPEGREQLPEKRFLDWPSDGHPAAVHAGLQALLILALQAGSKLADIIEEPRAAALCRATVARLIRHVPDPGTSKPAAALMVLAGLGDPVRLNRDVLAVDAYRNLSTFIGFYVLQARARAGDIQGCLDLIRTYWGAMLDLGATTFWEDFNLDWVPGAGRIDELTPTGLKDIHGDFGAFCYQGFRHSLCHGWASGPTAWLSEHILGVQVVEPGCRVVRIEPHLGDLDWAEGAFPTPFGKLLIRHVKQADGTIDSTIQAPPSIRCLGPGIQSPAHEKG